MFPVPVLPNPILPEPVLPPPKLPLPLLPIPKFLLPRLPEPILPEPRLPLPTFPFPSLPLPRLFLPTLPRPRLNVFGVAAFVGGVATGVLVVPGVIDRFLMNSDSEGFAGVLVAAGALVTTGVFVTTGVDVVAAVTGVLLADPESVEEGRGVTDLRAGEAADEPVDDDAALRGDFASRVDDVVESESA